MKKTLLAVMIVLVVLSIGTLAFAYSGNLTGVWKSDKGGTVYIRQVGSDVYWYSEDSPENPRATNVAFGSISSDNRMHMNWADVPKGGNHGYGTITIMILSDNELVREDATGGLASKRWMRE